MTQPVRADAKTLKELALTLSVRSGQFCAARTGVTLTLYYGKPMRELSGTVGELFARYLSVIPAGSIRSSLSTTGVWRDFTKDGFARRLRRLAADGLDYSSVHLSSGAPGNVGDYGFHFFGSNLRKADIKPRETCAVIFEFPLEALESDRKQQFVEFAAAIGEIEPCEAGHGGYAFKHLSETWRDQALSWISQQAPRFIALDISYDSLRNVARGRVVNVSWITLLGEALTIELGGEPAIKEKLSAEIFVRPLRTGLMLIAGDEPPIGDVNRGATDVALLKEVSALTKSVRAQMEIGFGGDAFRHSWLNRLD